MIKLSGERYMVTGGAGFIGSHICEELVNQGKEVICVDNMVAGKLGNLYNWWNKKTCSFAGLSTYSPKFKNLMEDYGKIDAIFHNAASKCTVCRKNPTLDLKSNIIGSFNVFSLARKYGAKVIHASTGSVNNYKPASFYGASKASAELYASALQSYYPEFKIVILRYYHVYGPRQESSNLGGVVPIFIRNIYNDEPTILHDNGQQTRHFTHVKDVVAANFLAAENSSMDGGTFDVVSDDKRTIRELSEILHFSMGKPLKIQNMPQRPGDIRHFPDLSNELIKNYGFRQTISFIDGLDETIKWFENEFKLEL